MIFSLQIEIWYVTFLEIERTHCDWLKKKFTKGNEHKENESYAYFSSLSWRNRNIFSVINLANKSNMYRKCKKKRRKYVNLFENRLLQCYRSIQSEKRYIKNIKITETCNSNETFCIFILEQGAAHVSVNNHDLFGY